MKYKALINGLDTEAEYSYELIQKQLYPLLRRLKELQEKKGKRVLAMLAAPPGAGKTTLLSFLKYLSKDLDMNSLAVIGMDGFHRYQDYLLTHSLVRDGKEIRMVDVKGTPETFDVDRLIERVKMLAAGENCGWPDYDRTTHNPKEDAQIVTEDIVILEGNYLLLKRDKWSELKNFADLTISLKADEDILRKRLIERKIKTGCSREDAEKFVEFSDLYNVRICLNESDDADIELDFFN